MLSMSTLNVKYDTLYFKQSSKILDITETSLCREKLKVAAQSIECLLTGSSFPRDYWCLFYQSLLTGGDSFTLQKAIYLIIYYMSYI